MASRYTRAKTRPEGFYWCRWRVWAESGKPWSAPVVLEWLGGCWWGAGSAEMLSERIRVRPLGRRLIPPVEEPTNGK